MQPHRIGVANFACGEVPEMYCIYEIDAVCSPEHCEANFHARGSRNVLHL